jgi:hypothetical protein
LPSDKIVETSALDLTADFLGQTSTKVNEALKEAKGGVLFIDEAYNLGFGPYGKEACDTIVAGMTSEEYRDVVIVIAGYPHEIEEMLRSNSGLKSRFTHFFEFPDWGPNDCKSFFEMFSGKQNFDLEYGIVDAIEKGCSKLMQLDGWGNGRCVTKLWEEAKSNRDARVFHTGEMERMLSLKDAERALESMLKARQPKTKKEGIVSSKISNSYPPEIAFGNQEARPQNMEMEMDRTEKQREAELLSEEVSNYPEEMCSSHGPQSGNHDENGRDGGVPDEIWDELQDSKRGEKKRLEELWLLQTKYKELQAAEEEAQRRHEEELERLRLKKEREERERAIREAEEAERRRREEAEAESKRIEDELRQREEERRKLEAIKRRLQQIRPCPMGFSWYKCGSGWRCGGGSHYVGDEELRRKFGSDV